MKTLLKLEELFLLILSFYLFFILNFPWWWFIALILIPDLGMTGYIINTKVGAVVYNIFHHRAISILIYLIGTFENSQVVQLVGMILFAHSTLDRIFNLGLKYYDNFKHTHLSEENYVQDKK